MEVSFREFLQQFDGFTATLRLHVKVVLQCLRYALGLLGDGPASIEAEVDVIEIVVQHQRNRPALPHNVAGNILPAGWNFYLRIAFLNGISN